MPTIQKEAPLPVNNPKALFTLKVHRGEGMALLAMNWKKGSPPRDFVGFSIEYMEPGGNRFFALKNRLSFPDKDGRVSKVSTSSLLAPFQKFRWVHFPRNADMKGSFIYKVMPVFMNTSHELSYGEAQLAAVELSRETFADKLNIAFTRGFVSSQAFVDKYGENGGTGTLLPPKAADGLTYTPTHPKAQEALTWMGFEATDAIIKLLDEALADSQAEVRVAAYDLNHPEIVSRLEQLGTRLKVIIDDSIDHKKPGAAENEAQRRLEASTPGGVKRQHMGQLQHNKTIVVNGPRVKAALFGSTNFSWRGFYVQANNAIVVRGAKAIIPFLEAFDNYWNLDSERFRTKKPANWNSLGLSGIDAQITFSPHFGRNSKLDEVADDLAQNTQSSVFYSMAFLYQTPGRILDTINALTGNDDLFVYGISDRPVGGIDVQKPDGNVAPVYPIELTRNFPEPFKKEANGGAGIRMHHKFVVVDFDKPTARVYTGSYNFSASADLKNGENLVVIRNKRVAVAYMIEALRLFDHYHFRVAQKEARQTGKRLMLTPAPADEAAKPWWDEYYTDKRKIKDREMFSK